MNTSIKNRRKLKKALLYDDKFLYIFISVFVIIYTSAYLKNATVNRNGIITKIENTEKKQVITFKYKKNRDILYDSLVKTFKNIEEKEANNAFISDIEPNNNKTIAFNLLTNKPEKVVFEYIDVSRASNQKGFWDYFPPIRILLFAVTCLIFYIPYRIRRNKFLVLINGFCTDGKYLKTKRNFGAGSEYSSHYEQYYTYQAFNKSYKTYSITSSDISFEFVQIIFQIDNPKNAVVYEHQSKRLKELIYSENINLTNDNKEIKHQNIKLIRKNYREQRE